MTIKNFFQSGPGRWVVLAILVELLFIAVLAPLAWRVLDAIRELHGRAAAKKENTSTRLVAPPQEFYIMEVSAAAGSSKTGAKDGGAQAVFIDPAETLAPATGPGPADTAARQSEAPADPSLYQVSVRTDAAWSEWMSDQKVEVAVSANGYQAGVRAIVFTWPANGFALTQIPDHRVAEELRFDGSYPQALLAILAQAREELGPGIRVYALYNQEQYRVRMQAVDEALRNRGVNPERIAAVLVRWRRLGGSGGAGWRLVIESVTNAFREGE